MSQQFIAAPYAVPSWATIFPQYHDLPPNVRITLVPTSNGNGITILNSTYLRVVVPGNSEVNVTYSLKWNWSSPYNILLSFNLVPPSTSDFQVNLFMGGNDLMELSPIPVPPSVSVTPGKLNHITFSTENVNPSNSPYVQSLPVQDQALASIELPKLLLPRPGVYTVVLSVDNTGNSPETFLISNPHYSSLGYAYVGSALTIMERACSQSLFMALGSIYIYP